MLGVEKQLLGFAFGGYTKKVSFAGIERYKRTGGMGKEESSELGPTKETIILLNKAGKVYKIWAITQVKDQENYEGVFDKLFSSFSFTY